MNLRKSLLLTLVLLVSLSAGSLLIWHGLNLDTQEREEQVLGDQSPQVLPLVSPTAGSLIPGEERFLVTKVIDGDTIQIKINGKAVSVRLIGIDTPETVDPRRPVGCFGKKASNETKRLLEGNEVILTKDVTNADKYNRLLRYVYLPISGGDNLFVNDYLVRQGFAKNYTYPPDVKYNERFLAAEKEARENLRGFWAECK
jgi:endonuclease YncB( thermonuclease family)